MAAPAVCVGLAGGAVVDGTGDASDVTCSRTGVCGAIRVCTHWTAYTAAIAAQSDAVRARVVHKRTSDTEDDAKELRVWLRLSVQNKL